MFKISKFLLFLLFPASLLFAQQDSALLEKIKNIDVSLTSLEEVDEDLYEVSVSFQSFYDELAADGEWIQISKEEINEDLLEGEGQSFSGFMQNDDEGVFIWKPAINKDADWHPFTNGKWVYTNQGWLWASDYKWGWAAYHYGRWWNSKNYGWVWLPGYVWAPAWVSWRISDEHIGWVPLSPKAKWKPEDGITTDNYNYKNKEADWVFVKKSDFDNDITKANIIDRKQNKELIKNSKKVLEIKKENSRMVNRGPDVNDIKKHTGRDIKEKIIDYKYQRNKPSIGINDVKLFKENFKKYEKDAKGKVNNLDKPKKYKKSLKIKMMLKKKFKERKNKKVQNK
ncbi:MAG: hypothetical protein EHM58_17135 [Ignavibacteriae bacterium]|nr:MAG: hypothetical protein EHM58_17135 [Ignavibacteriota bacterium]